MALKIIPELWVAKYVKSATNGRVISVRLSRILTLIIIPIWLIGFFFTVYYCYEAGLAIPQYQKVKEAIKMDELNIKSMDEMDMKDKEWPYNERLANEKQDKDMWESKIYGFAGILYYLLVCYLIPWIIIRLSFWIIDADKVKAESST